MEGQLVAHYPLDGAGQSLGDALGIGAHAAATYRGEVKTDAALDGSPATNVTGAAAGLALPWSVTAQLLGSAARTVCLWARVDAWSAGAGLLAYGSVARRGGKFGDGSRPRRGADLDIPTGRGDAAAWIFRGDGSRPRRGADLDIPRGRGPAAAPTWIFRGDESRRRRTGYSGRNRTTRRRRG